MCSLTIAPPHSVSICFNVQLAYRPTGEVCIELAGFHLISTYMVVICRDDGAYTDLWGVIAIWLHQLHPPICTNICKYLQLEPKSVCPKKWRTQITG